VAAASTDFAGRVNHLNFTKAKWSHEKGRDVIISGAERSYLGWEVHRAQAEPQHNLPAPFMSDEPQWILDTVERVSPYDDAT
jgi:hypothetical protein